MPPCNSPRILCHCSLPAASHHRLPNCGRPPSSILQIHRYRRRIARPAKVDLVTKSRNRPAHNSVRPRKCLVVTLRSLRAHSEDRMLSPSPNEVNRMATTEQKISKRPWKTTPYPAQSVNRPSPLVSNRSRTPAAYSTRSACRNTSRRGSQRPTPTPLGSTSIPKRETTSDSTSIAAKTLQSTFTVPAASSAQTRFATAGRQSPPQRHGHSRRYAPSFQPRRMHPRPEAQWIQ